MISTSPTIGKLAGALAAAQSQMSHASKDATNPHFRSQYATLSAVLDVVRPALSAHGIAYLQGTHTERVTTTQVVGKNEHQRAELIDGMRVEVSTTLMHESGEWVETTVQTVIPSVAPQPIGSAISYLRRYAIQSIVGVASTDSDDDAEAARAAAPVREPAADLPSLRFKLQQMGLDPVVVETYCESIERPWSTLSGSAATRLLDACMAGKKFRSELDQYISNKGAK